MRILLTTPIYPPDVIEPAPYCKELGRRLALEHQVTILLYGHLPESTDGVTYGCVDKRHSTISRILRFSIRMLSLSRQADCVLVLNGTSVEIPTIITSLLSNTPIIFYECDPKSIKRARQSRLLTWQLWLTRKLANHVITLEGRGSLPLPDSRPEIHPLKDRPEQDLKYYEASWTEHMSKLEKQLLAYGT